MRKAKARTKPKDQRSTPRGVLRLPDWWHSMAHRLDWAGRLAEKWAPHFDSRWLALTAVVFPLLLILIAFLFTQFR
ncbi:MAG: hypothetical protein KJZ86_27595 [Caldilineaceae bacterium]|nr:hypothetical protein [Caldilineaceae bacterium]